MNVIANPAKFHEQGSPQIHPVILSGGAGTRLWPLSRSALPKQLLPLASGRTMLQETAARGIADIGFSAPLLVCNEAHRFLVVEQLNEIGIRPMAVLLEPAGRNTGPAVTVAALWLLERDPDALMLVQPSDHVIATLPRFHDAIARGLAAAQDGMLVTFGVTPTDANPGYGYIQAVRPLDGAEGVLAVDRFVEKPDRETAQRFVDSGAFFWNSGIFLLAARSYIDELDRLNPEMLAACQRAVREAREQRQDELGFFQLGGGAFAEAPPLPVDRAVMEHTDRAAMVPVDMAWSDVGSWRALRAIGPADGDGNVVVGDAIVSGSRNSYVRSEGRLVAVIGLDNAVVVATDDAVLVTHGDAAGEVASLVELMRKNNRPEPDHHTTTHRPWGNYRTIDAGERFQVKRITVKPGAKLSLQHHHHRAEHWIVVRGTALIQVGEERRLLGENEYVHIPLGATHRLENPGKLPLQLIEVQCGSYLGEDDIVRSDDTYGRS